MEEDWKDIEGYEGLYQISNYGRVYSYYSNKMLKVCLTITKRKTDYKSYIVRLSKDKKGKTFKLAPLVWDHFGDKKRNGHKLQVDHIDNDQTNNRIDNLQLLTNRENVIKEINKTKTKSKFTGVEIKDNKYITCRIIIDGKRIYLGSFDNEYDAHLAYEKKLKEIN